jgi:hypothetical protein
MKYITVREARDEQSHIGTIKIEGDIEARLREAIRSHFDEDMIAYKFVESEVRSIEDCMGGYPIDLEIELESGLECTIEVSETWIY